LTAVDSAAAAEARMREFCARRRNVVLKGLKGVPGLNCHAPDAGMFMLIDVWGTGLSGHEFTAELYRSERVSLLDAGAFGQGSAGFVRLCYATEEARLAEACARIRRFAERRQRRTGGVP